MRLLQPIFLFTFLLASIVSATTHVAVLETISEKGVIGRSEKMFLTDKIRERAKAVLPAYMDYVIMTRENISAMLPPGKSIEECEGTCLVETGKNISADYVAQARVGKFGKQLTLTMELYETAGNNLVGSFTTRKPNAEGLLEELDKEVEHVFQLILGTSGPIENKQNINEISIEENSPTSSKKSYIVHVSSSPEGAMFSVDGRVSRGCNKAPCDMLLSEGTHNFLFSMDLHHDKNVVANIQKNNQSVSAILETNFGELTLAPIFADDMGNLKESEITIDGRQIQGKKFRLQAGTHEIKIAHRCYEPLSLEIDIKNKSSITINQRLQALLSGLELNAIIDGENKSVPVYINGKKAGNTPFLETIPLCATIQAGSRKDTIHIELEKGEITKYTYNSVEELKDSRDGKNYKIVKIGNQVWMAENLNYKAKESWCYENKKTNCSKYGRLYNWNTAKEACPSEWHLPSKKEFATLFKMIGGKNTAGRVLKSKSTWKKFGFAKDTYDFSILPAGIRRLNGSFDGEYYLTYFWNSNEYEGNEAGAMYMNNNDNEAKLNSFDKDFAFSIRCVKDD